MTPTASVSLAPPSTALLRRLHSVREASLQLAKPLTPEDMMVQSCSEASPAKWHLAHTSWFFETFLLREFLPGYRPFHPDYLWLFNSYYNSVSDQPQKKLRASFSRPGLQAILEYRAYVDRHLSLLFAGDAPREAVRRLVLGLHHEQQHGELLLTDIKHALWSNPLRPAYLEEPLPGDAAAMTRQLRGQQWVSFPEGLTEIGWNASPGQAEGSSPPDSPEDAFCFDNELPRHRVWLDAYQLASRPVSSAEYLQFMEDDGYTRSELWLAEGWEAVQREAWRAPLYWHRDEDCPDWTVFTLRGEQPLSALLATPVCHISYFEADAFARWAGLSLPSEGEWEHAAATASVDPEDLLEGGALHPLARALQAGLAQDELAHNGLAHDGLARNGLEQVYGGVWEWTRSAYLGYPGYAAVPGALGEYNGKFMSNQMVLRGGSAITPSSHIRASYRNFFPPHTRWQFAGVRLARR